MTSQIWYVGEYAVDPNKVDTFRSLIQQAIEIEQSASDLLTYEFFTGEDEQTFYAIESFRDSEALLGHIERCGDVMTKIMEVSKIKRFEIYGDASDPLRETLAPFEPKIFPHWTGFARPT